MIALLLNATIESSMQAFVVLERGGHSIGEIGAELLQEPSHMSRLMGEERAEIFDH